MLQHCMHLAHAAVEHDSQGGHTTEPCCRHRLPGCLREARPGPAQIHHEVQLVLHVLGQGPLLREVVIPSAATDFFG